MRERALIWVNCAALVAAAGLSLGCGCAASSERRSEQSAAETAARHEAWGATFALPPGWSGGENEAGGIELTDGELALMIGRHEIAEGEAFEAFAEGRRRALAELGAAGALEQSEQRIGGERALAFRGQGAEGVEVRLLVVRLEPRVGLGFLLVGAAREGVRLEAAWSKLLGSLELPPQRK